MTGNKIKELNFSIDWRKGDVGLRVIQTKDKDLKPELVIYERNDKGEEFCYVAAFFELTREGYDIRTVGTRLFDAMNNFYIDYNDFIDAVRYFHNVINSLDDLQKVLDR